MVTEIPINTQKPTCILCCFVQPSGTRSDTYGWTERHDEASYLFSLFKRMRLKHSGNGLLIIDGIYSLLTLLVNYVVGYGGSPALP